MKPLNGRGQILLLPALTQATVFFQGYNGQTTAPVVANVHINHTCNSAIARVHLPDADLHTDTLLLD